MNNSFKKYALLTIAVVVTVLLITVLYVKKKTVTIVIDGQEKKFVTYKSTVGEALAHENILIADKDKITPDLSAKLSKNDTITLKHAVSINVNVDGKELCIKSAAENVDSLIKSEGIQLNPEDKIKPGKETSLSEGMKIDIVRVETKTITESVNLDFKTIVKNDKNLANTEKKTIQQGKKGEKQIITKVVYENGKEVSRKLINESIIKKPLDKIIVMGTLPVLPISRGGSAVPYTKVIRAKATAYHAINGVGKTYTASGRKAVRNSGGYSTIAVDPSVIPIGSRVFIEGYGFAVAADTGTAIKGNIIDVFFNTSSEARNWAVKYVNVYVLK